MHVGHSRRDVRPHAAGVPDVSPELLGEPYLLQPQTIDAGERAEHLLTADERHVGSGDDLRERLVLAGIRGAIDKKQSLFRRPNHDVEFPVPTKQALLRRSTSTALAGPLRRQACVPAG